MEPDDKIILLAYPPMIPLARDLQRLYVPYFTFLEIEWNKFPDGTPNIKFPAAQLENKNVVFLGSLYDVRTLFEQVSMTIVLPRQFIKSLTIVYPFYPTGTMERVDVEGTLATAETMFKMMTAPLPLTRSGPSNLIIYDIHAVVERFYPTDQVFMRMKSAIPLLLDELNLMMDRYTICFPDEGSSKRFKHLFPKNIPMIVCSKVREGDSRRIRIVDRINCPENYLLGIVIIDDLVQSGTTLYETFLALKQEGGRNISAFVTHPVFPQESYRPFLPGGKRGGFSNFFITDTIPEVSGNLPLPFRLIKIAPSLGEDLVRLLDVKILRRPLNVYLSSENHNKIEATRVAFKRVLPLINLNLVPQKVPSGVPEQPIGREMISQGARTRCLNLNHPDDLSISMENGIYTKNSHPPTWYDAASVVIHLKGKTWETWSEEVLIPQEIINKYEEKSGNPNIGIGDISKELYASRPLSPSDEESPHYQYLIRRSRRYYLSKALERLLEENAREILPLLPILSML